MAIVRKLAFVIIGLALLSLWSNFVYRNAENKGKSGFIQTAIREFSTLPQQARNYWNNREYLVMTQTYIDPDADMEEVNLLQTDLFILNSYWDENTNEWVTDLRNLKSEETLQEWRTDKSIISSEKTDQIFRDQRPLHSFVNPDASVIINFTEVLLALDKNSKTLWRNEDFGFHHSINQDSIGNIWACANKHIKGDPLFSGINAALINLNGKNMPYEDNIICKIDLKTGETLYQKSISEILIENDLDGILYNSLDYRGDPIHLNDIQPALTTTDYWDEGDLFISLRSPGVILLYSPVTNTVKDVIGGPFLAQHDVDIISDSSIVIFDNRMNKSYRYVSNTDKPLDVFQTLHSNRIVKYDFATEEFTFPYLALFERENIDTESEGLLEYLNGNRVFVEEQNTGKVFVFSGSDVLLRKQFPVDGREKVHLTNWIRPFDTNPLR